MATDTHRDNPITGHVFALTPHAPPAASVAVGKRFACRTEDASGGQISGLASFDDLVSEKMIPVVGPIAVDGVTVGDAVGIQIHAIVPVAPGHTWTRPGLGFASPVGFAVRRLDPTRPVIDWGTGPAITVPTRLHIGALGVLPDVARATRTLGTYGGNLDSVLCGEGAVVWLAAQVDGGGVFLGDVHASIGDGEVCGTGIEVAAAVDLTVRHEPDWSPRLPTVVVHGRTWLISVGDTLEDALDLAVEECVRAMSASWGMSVSDAYLAVGLLLRVDVCQVVNPRKSVAVTLSGGADAALAPTAVRA